MKQAFNRLFWGYLFTFFEIHIFFVDILADPLGYYLIFSGLALLLKDFPIAYKAKNLSLALMFVSLPTVIIQENQLVFLLGWSLYMTILSIVKLILVFYIFQLIMAVVEKHGDLRIISRSRKTFLIYMVVLFSSHLTNSFMMNVSYSFSVSITVILAIIGFIIEIVFLSLLWSLRKIKLNDLDLKSA